MARPRKPTAALELAGAYKKDPARKRARKGEPKPDAPLGEPPATLQELEADVWRELAAAAPWLTGADRAALEIATRLMFAFRVASIVDYKIVGPLISALAKLGMTPADRSKIGAPTGKEEDAANPSGFAAFK